MTLFLIIHKKIMFIIIIIIIIIIITITTTIIISNFNTIICLKAKRFTNLEIEITIIFIF